MMPSDIRFWFGYFYAGQPDMGAVNHGLGPCPDDASNGDHRCEIIPFPTADAGYVAPQPAKTPRPSWRRVRKNAEMIWSHPKTQGAFVVQRLVAITLAVTLASLFERMCE